MILRASEKFLIIIIFITLNMNREYYKFIETVVISLEEKIKQFRFKINNASTYYKYLNII